MALEAAPPYPILREDLPVHPISRINRTIRDTMRSNPRRYEQTVEWPERDIPLRALQKVTLTFDPATGPNIRYWASLHVLRKKENPSGDPIFALWKNHHAKHDLIQVENRSNIPLFFQEEEGAQPRMIRPQSFIAVRRAQLIYRPQITVPEGSAPRNRTQFLCTFSSQVQTFSLPLKKVQSLKIERAARRNPAPFRAGSSELSIGCGKVLAAPYRSGESPSLEEGVLQNGELFYTIIEEMESEEGERKTFASIDQPHLQFFETTDQYRILVEYSDGRKNVGIFPSHFQLRREPSIPIMIRNQVERPIQLISPGGIRRITIYTLERIPRAIIDNLPPPA